MIRIHEAAALAYTKLKTRKVRLIITVTISCLLFSGLAAASLVFRGAFKGVDDFSKEGFGSRYIVGGSLQNFGDFDILNNQELVSQAVIANKDLLARKKAEAARLEIPFDAAAEPLPYSEVDNGQGKQKMLDSMHPVGRKILSDYKATHPTPGLPELKKLAEPYGPSAFYESKEIGLGNPDYTIKVLKDGKEDFSPQQNNGGGPFTRGTESFTTGWQLISGSLLQPFMLPAANQEVGTDGSLPVVAPYTAVEQLLSLQPLAGNASPSEKLERIREVRSKANSITFSVCYRNQTSYTSVDQANQLQQELVRNKDKKDFQKPSLISDLPKTPCGPVEVVRDVRTADEKKLTTKQEQFRQIFGEEPVTSQTLKLRVIGIAPDPPDFAAFGVSQIFASILTSSVGSGWFTPLEAKSDPSVLNKIFTPSGVNGGFMQTPAALVEFPDAQKAAAFIEQQNCQPEFGPGANFSSPSGPFEKCIKEGKPFSLAPFGSSSLAIVEIKKGFNKFFKIAATVIAIIAAIIMMGTLGRIIADSRRETAVFRAIGAKRLDIAQIYLTYSIMLSLLVVGLALLIGLILASIADARYAPDLTVQALLAYNAQDLTRELHLYAFELRDMAYLVGFTLLAGLSSAVLPLLNNLRRNPIQDMRDEN